VLKFFAAPSIFVLLINPGAIELKSLYPFSSPYWLLFLSLRFSVSFPSPPPNLRFFDFSLIDHSGTGQVPLVLARQQTFF